MNVLHTLQLSVLVRGAEYQRAVASYWRGTRASRGRRVRHMLRVGMVLLAVFFLLPLAQMALAVDGQEFTGPLAAITAHDHLNNPVAAYELSIDEGQNHRAQGKIFPAMLLNWLWEYYVICVGNALMLVNIILEFKFVTWLEGPAKLLETTLDTVLDQLGLLGLLLTIAAAIAGWHAIRGRIGLAITQFLIACTIGALADGLLSSPVGLLSGEDGLLQQAADFGSALTTELMATDPESGEVVHSGGGLSNTVTTELVETFIRLPHQLINYGANLDAVGSEDCVNTYNDMLGKSPWGRNPGFRDNVGSACGEQYKETAIEPAQLIPAALIVIPGGALLTLMVLVLAIGVFLACLWAFLEAAMLVVHLLKGVLPGEGRADMWRSVGVVGWAVLICSLALFFLAVMVLVIRAVYDGMGQDNPFMTFAVVDIALLVGVYFAWRTVMGVRKKGKRLGDQLHRATGGNPSTATSTARWTGAAGKVVSGGVRTARSGVRLARGASVARPATSIAPQARSPMRNVASKAASVGVTAASYSPAAPVARTARVARHAHTAYHLRRAHLNRRLNGGGGR